MSRKHPTEFVKVVIQDGSSDSEEVQCGKCNKSFSTMKALNNHSFMEHMESPSADVTVVRKVEKRPAPKLHPVKIIKKPLDKRREEILATMEPTSITTLASEDVSYIIVRSDDDLMPEKKKKEKRTQLKRDHSPQPITGPFECLEPSPVGAEGTCHQIFFSCCEYSNHAYTEHTRRRRIARCQVCERPLGANADAPLNCQNCGEGFQTPEQLQDHMQQKHTKERPYECEVCHKRFTQQGGVVQHMRMHTGVRPFPCTFCNKAFTQKSGLEQHLRTHTKVKPYRCVVCAKCFAQSVHLKQHMRTHTQLAPFRCLVCDKRFKQSSHLNYHLRYHDPTQLSEEQKHKYDQLVALIRKHGHTDNITSEVVEIEEEVQTEQPDELTEQIIAEQSIQEDNDTYIIGDHYYQ